jgi:hypothetical protein
VEADEILKGEKNREEEEAGLLVARELHVSN